MADISLVTATHIWERLSEDHNTFWAIIAVTPGTAAKAYIRAIGNTDLPTLKQTLMEDEVEVKKIEDGWRRGRGRCARRRFASLLILAQTASGSAEGACVCVSELRGRSC